MEGRYLNKYSSNGLHKQVNQYIQWPILYNVDWTKYKAKKNIHRFNYLQFGVTINFLLNAQMKYHGETIYFFVPLGTKNVPSSNKEDFNTHLGFIIGFGTTNMERRFGYGFLTGFGLDTHTNKFLQIYLRYLLANKLLD
jgi:hypothetical protein